MEIRYCSFCGEKLEPGTGKMYIRKDGSILYFDSSKCEKNYLKLKREARDVLWTKEGHEARKSRSKVVKSQNEVKEEAKPAVKDIAENEEEKQ
ncbi:MAG: 50S ribosomal protein L24e [Thermoplasmata archaeon]